MQEFANVGLTIKSDLDAKDEVVERVIHLLRDADCTVYADPERVSSLPCAHDVKPIGSYEDLDLLLVIGGDGTILRALREANCPSLPILSVNRGTVGFLAEVGLKEAESVLPALLKGEHIREERSMLHVTVLRDGKTHYEGLCLNEVVIAQASIARLLDIQASVSGEELATYHADGLIVATPTGSTAYSLAAGGPIVHPRLSAIILTPINPHSFAQKPIVIPGEQEVRCMAHKNITKFHDNEVNLTLDGQIYQTLLPGDELVVRVHDQRLTFIRRPRDTFYATIRTKLKWGERLEE